MKVCKVCESICMSLKYERDLFLVEFNLSDFIPPFLTRVKTVFKTLAYAINFKINLAKEK